MSLRVLLFVVFAFAPILTAYAQIVGDPAGPRPGPVAILDLAFTDRATLQHLTDEGYNITHVRPGHAELHATFDERDKLIADGYTVVQIGQQPDPIEFGPATRAFGTFYHDYDMLTTELFTYAAAFPSITKLTTLGKSVQGRHLWAILITDNPEVEEDEPEFKYVGTMHGDEPVGTENCLRFIDRLLNDYGSDSRITTLVDETAIWICPLMNPDGLEAGTRMNANGFDLNRSFPKFPTDFLQTRFDEGALLLGLEPEVRKLMKWTLNNSFVLSANFHGGALVVSYAYDADVGVPDGDYAASPDDALFIDMSNTYASNNPPMSTNNVLTFTNGITNGNEWFIVQGGMQDWMYRFNGDFEVTIEVSNVKTPNASTLPQFWADNEESMLSYLERVHEGVRGIVTDDSSGDPIRAKVTVAGNTQPVISDPDVGDYYRLLLPGTYELTFVAFGYAPLTVPGVVVTSGSATRLDVQMASIVVPTGNRPGLAITALALAACALIALRRRDANAP